jgi:hypothetical protein
MSHSVRPIVYLTMRSRSTYDEDGNYSSVPPPPRDLVRISQGIMELHWNRYYGFTMPNAVSYPWMWLWDSCFHAVIWAALGDGRCTIELESVFDYQTSSGFVPHMGYQSNTAKGAEHWGVEGHSTITQPPMYGHALRYLTTLGYECQHLFDRVRAGLEYFFRSRQSENGLIPIFHPWESGADDNPRWERWQPSPFNRRGWLQTKLDLVKRLDVRDEEAVGNDAFHVYDSGFNALVAFNAIEAALVLGDSDLQKKGEDLARTIDELLWREELGTWVDLDRDMTISSSIRDSDGLLPVLVTNSSSRYKRVMAELTDRTMFGKPFGPSGVHPGEKSYVPTGYWRGAAWPQITYLFWRAALKAGDESTAGFLSMCLERGAETSGFAEYWNPETGEGLGARPQSWTCLSIVPVMELRHSIGTWSKQ